MLNGDSIVLGNFIFVWNKNFNLKGFFGIKSSLTYHT